MYTAEEKIQIIKWYYNSNSADEVIQQFAMAFPDRPLPVVQTVLNIVHKFGSQGCIHTCKKCTYDSTHQQQKGSSS